MANQHQAVYRALLALYPRAFRKEYAEPMAQLFADRLGDRARRVWLEVAPDLLRTVPVQRMEALMSRLSTGARVVALAVIVLGAVLVSVGLRGGAAPLFVVLAVVGAVYAVVKQYRIVVPFGERAPLWPSVIQAWWAPVAALLASSCWRAASGPCSEAPTSVGASSVGPAAGAGRHHAAGPDAPALRPGVGQLDDPRVHRPRVRVLVGRRAPLVGLVVWIGVVSAGFSDEPATATTG